MDQTFFKVLHTDLDTIQRYIDEADVKLARSLAVIQRKAIDLGIIFERKSLEQLADTISYKFNDSRQICRQLLKLKMEINQKPTHAIQQVMKDFDSWLAELNQHVKYIEINAAGFRKLLKQREKQLWKQVPRGEHGEAFEENCFPLADFGWALIVTPRVRLLIIAAEKMRQTFDFIGSEMQIAISLREVSQLGTESYTCVQITRDVQKCVYPVQWMDVRPQKTVVRI